MAEEVTEELSAKGMEHVWFPSSAESKLGDHQNVSTAWPSSLIQFIDCALEKEIK